MPYTETMLSEYPRIDQPLRIVLDGICDQCDKHQYWNAMHRLLELQAELLRRQQLLTPPAPPTTTGQQPTVLR